MPPKSKTSTSQLPPPSPSPLDLSGQISVISLDDLVQDPANLRVHPEQNKKVIRGSVRRFGPARSIVIDQGGVIIAGNETANACAAEGLKEVLVVDPKPGQLVAVRRSDWNEAEKTGYGIADNRSGLDATWAPELGEAIHSLQLDDFDLSALGFDEAELKHFLNDAGDSSLDDKANGREYNESVAGEVQFHKCPSCGHEFPK